jgi:hypothetical protein
MLLNQLFFCKKYDVHVIHSQTIVHNVRIFEIKRYRFHTQKCHRVISFYRQPRTKILAKTVTYSARENHDNSKLRNFILSPAATEHEQWMILKYFIQIHLWKLFVRKCIFYSDFRPLFSSLHQILHIVCSNGNGA